MDIMSMLKSINDGSNKAVLVLRTVMSPEGGYGSLHERLRHFVRFFYGPKCCNLQSEICNRPSLNALRPTPYALRLLSSALRAKAPYSSIQSSSNRKI